VETALVVVVLVVLVASAFGIAWSRRRTRFHRARRERSANELRDLERRVGETERQIRKPD
jgi:cell division protein FtsL